MQMVSAVKLGKSEEELRTFLRLCPESKLVTVICCMANEAEKCPPHHSMLISRPVKKSAYIVITSLTAVW